MAGNESEVKNEPEMQAPSAAPTAMLIRIFGKKDREPYGDIVHYDLRKPVPYQGAAELVLRIDAISRSLDLITSGNTFRSVRRPGDEDINILPEEYRKNQSLGQKETLPESTAVSGVRNTAPEAGENPETRCSPEAGESLEAGYSQEAGNPAKNRDTPPVRVRDTIYLQLIGRQHTSIQGRIWGRVTRKKYVSFRSALELIYLLSEAV